MHVISTVTIARLLTAVSGLIIAAQAFAQSSSADYRPIKRLGGTNQSICRPAINTAAELQSFALNQRQDVIDILQSANWPGDPDAVLKAIDTGEFSEKLYPVGTRMEWMGLRKQGVPVASGKREWAGKQSFEGYELNIVANCVQHQLVIPKACCNVSLIQSTPVDVSSPVISVSKEGQNVTITVNSFGADTETRLFHPDGSSETLTLTDGSWTGMLDPGNYKVESISKSECGNSIPVIYTFGAAPIVPIVPAGTAATASPAGGFFLAPFIGRQVRSIDPPLVGLQAGWLGAINEHTDWFIQGGGSYNLDAEELSIFADLGIERKFGTKGGFIGGGVGIWDINNSDDLPNSTSPKTDVSYFIHGGANTPWIFHERPVQWFAEARIFNDFTDDISHHNVLKLGLRYMF